MNFFNKTSAAISSDIVDKLQEIQDSRRPENTFFGAWFTQELGRVLRELFIHHHHVSPKPSDALRLAKEISRDSRVIRFKADNNAFSDGEYNLDLILVQYSDEDTESFKLRYQDLCKAVEELHGQNLSVQAQFFTCAIRSRSGSLFSEPEHHFVKNSLFDYVQGYNFQLKENAENYRDLTSQIYNQMVLDEYVLKIDYSKKNYGILCKPQTPFSNQPGHKVYIANTTTSKEEFQKDLKDQVDRQKVDDVQRRVEEFVNNNLDNDPEVKAALAAKKAAKIALTKAREQANERLRTQIKPLLENDSVLDF